MPVSPSTSSAWMSWYDRYLAPGDLRLRRQQTAPPQTAPVSGAPNGDASPTPITPSQGGLYDAFAPLTPERRHRRQNVLFLAGLTFTLASLSLTRRTITRKRIVSYPHLFTPSHMHIEPPPGPIQNSSKVEGSLLAIEALGLATMNVVSLFMVGVGGAMCWWDVSSVEELRGRVEMRGVGVEGLRDEEGEREVAEWVAGAFGGGTPAKQEGAGEGEKGAEGKTGIGAIGTEALRQGVIRQLEEGKKVRGWEGEEKR